MSCENADNCQKAFVVVPNEGLLEAGTADYKGLRDKMKNIRFLPNATTKSTQHFEYDICIIVGISHHVICHVTDHQTHKAADCSF